MAEILKAFGHLIARKRIELVLPEEKSDQEVNRFLVSGDTEEEVLRKLEKRAYLPEKDVITWGEETELVSWVNCQKFLCRGLFSKSKQLRIGALYRPGTIAIDLSIIEQRGLTLAILAKSYYAEVFDQKEWHPHPRQVPADRS